MEKWKNSMAMNNDIMESKYKIPQNFGQFGVFDIILICSTNINQKPSLMNQYFSN